MAKKKISEIITEESLKKLLSKASHTREHSIRL